jgi:hypothetical protein
MYLDIIWTNGGPTDLGGPERSHTLRTLRAGPVHHWGDVAYLYMSDCTLRWLLLGFVLW